VPLVDRSRVNPYGLFLAYSAGMALLTTVAFTTSVVYWVQSAHLNPFQLLVLGTVLEAVYFVLQIPTGLLADLTSRRACVVAGVLVYAAALLLQGAVPTFAGLVSAQAVLALGAALMSGAVETWASAEIQEAQMGSVYLRATRLGFVATIAGSLLSGVLALIGLNAPMLISGGLMAAGGVALALVMPEQPFRAPAASVPIGLGGVLRRTGQDLGGQLRATGRATRLVPGVFLLFGATFFIGMWSESYDRLSGAFLLHDLAFPHVGGLQPAMWFGFIGCVTAVLGVVVTGWAERRTERLGQDALVGMLVLFTVVTAGGIVALSLSTAFAEAVVFLLLISVFRPLFGPLFSGWLVVRVAPEVRATTLSAQGMFDSGGQILGGPVVGAIGSLVSIRAAMLAGAAALAPAVLMLAGLTRRGKAGPGPGRGPGGGRRGSAGRGRAGRARIGAR
jgi:DHA3 family tetracycline resistance protein-like MFS transporter